jgi:small conductance mechanosensitive channel
MQGGKEALDDAGIEIPFPHQVAVPYGDADHHSIDAPVAGKVG